METQQMNRIKFASKRVFSDSTLILSHICEIKGAKPEGA